MEPIGRNLRVQPLAHTVTPLRGGHMLLIKQHEFEVFEYLNALKFSIVE